MQTEEKQIVKFMNSKVDPTYIWHTAKDAAVKAVDEYMKDKEEPMYCRCAKVKVGPGKGKIVKSVRRGRISDIK